MDTRWLNEIIEIEGVEGVFIASNRGQILMRDGVQFDLRTMEGIAVHVLRIISSYYLAGRNLKEIEIIWNKHRIVARNTNEFVIITFCSSVKALSLLRITLNVVISHLMEDKKFMKQIKKHASEKTVLLRKGNLDRLEIELISKLQ